MRIFVAGIATETNSFSPIFVGLDDFKASLYAAPYEHPKTPTLCTAALIELRKKASQENITLIEGTTCWADPGGLVSKHCYETLRDEILNQVKEATKHERLDGVVLCLHGAMMAQGYDDPEGDLIHKIRLLVGDNTIIGASLDPHSHLTTKRFEFANLLCAFKEFPHTDFEQTGEQIVDLVIRTIKGEINPKMAQFDCKMIDVFPSSHQPMRQFVDEMIKTEQQVNVLSLSLIHGFMAGDSPWMGTKMIAIYNGDIKQAEHLAKDFGEKIIKIRGQSMPETVSEETASEMAFDLVANGKSPIIIADVWDNPGGGVAGDGTVIMQSLLNYNPSHQDIKISVGTIWDPIAVKLCFKAGEGAVIPLRFGAKSAPFTGHPIDRLVRVKLLNPEASQTFGKSLVPMGASALIEFDGVQVILNSTRAQAFEPSLFENMGIDPTSQDILVIKSTNHFYAEFRKISDQIIYCDAGKPYPNDPKNTAYIKAPKNIWPINNNPWNSIKLKEPLAKVTIIQAPNPHETG